MGCSASDEAADDIEVEEDYEATLDAPPRRRKVVLTIDPIDPDMGSTFKYTAWNTDTVLMLMAKLQEEITRAFGVDREHLLPVLWEPVLHYQGNPLVAHFYGAPLYSLKIDGAANMRLEVHALSGLPGHLTKNRPMEGPPPRNKNASTGGDLWNAKSIKRQDFGIKMKTKPPKRDPRAVLSESCHNVVVVEMGTEKLQKKLKKYMVVVGVESRNEKSLKNVDFKEVMKLIKIDKRPLSLTFRSHDDRLVSHTFKEEGSLNVRFVDRFKLLNDEYTDLTHEFLASPRGREGKDGRRKVKDELDKLDGYIDHARFASPPRR